jgi:hypothetical protein
LRILHQRIHASIALAVILGIPACKETRHYPLGKVAVRVLDANSKPVRGAAADLYKLTPAGKVYWRASRTDSAGIAVLGAKDGGIIQGDYLIHVSFITWHELAKGETNDKPISIREGDDTLITFRVVAKVPVRPRRVPGTGAEGGGNARGSTSEIPQAISFFRE